MFFNLPLCLFSFCSPQDSPAFRRKHFSTNLIISIYDYLSIAEHQEAKSSAEALLRHKHTQQPRGF